MEYLNLDFETRSLIDIKMGAWRYAEDPSTSLLCMAYQLPHQSEPTLWWPHMPFPAAIRTWLVEGGAMRGFNVEFELAIYINLMMKQYDLPKLKRDQLYCTQADAMAMNLPGALGDCAKALRLPQDKLKDAEGKRLIQYLCRPYKGAFREDPVRLEAMGRYCVQDVVTEMAVMRKTRRLDPREQELFQRNLVMNYQGLPVNLAQCDEMSRRYHELKAGAISSCKVMTGGISPTQTKLFTEWTGLPNMQKDTVADAIRDGHPKTEALLCRQAASSVSLAKLDKIPLITCKDGTLKGLFKFHGAGTGRWTSTGGFNAQNLPRGDVKMAEDMLHNIPGLSVVELVACLRSLFNFPMSVVDYSQIETRVLLWLAGDPGLREFRLGMDPYLTMVATLFNVKYEDLVKTDPRRQLGKTIVLACGFGQGHKKFVETAAKSDLIITLDESQHYINTFRAKHAKVEAAWGLCQDAAINAIRDPGHEFHACRTTFVVRAGYLWLILPSGRRIAYSSPHLTAGKEDWMGPQITFMGRDRYTRQWSKQTTYGGSLFQSITQGTGRDIMADAMFKMWDRGLDVRGLVHDEIICAGDVQLEMTECMLDLPAWCSDLPVAAEGWTGDYYRK